MIACRRRSVALLVSLACISPVLAQGRGDEGVGAAAQARSDAGGAATGDPANRPAALFGQPDRRDGAVERARAAAARAAAEQRKTEASAAVSVVPSPPVPPAEPVVAERHAAASGAPESIRAVIRRHAAANGVPFGLADAVVRIESRYNPRAAHAGNFGLMQIRHQTARSLGYAGSPAGLLDAETNARFGMKYLAEAYRLAGGDTCRTVMKYQGGHRAERMSGANRTYCAKVRTLSAAR